MKIKGKVTRVIDGDTVKVEISVRLNKIDAPETKGIEKPLGDITKEWLEKKVTGKYVTIESKANDIYFRMLGDLTLGAENINQELLDERLVEVYTPAHHNNGKLDI